MAKVRTLLVNLFLIFAFIGILMLTGCPAPERRPAPAPVPPQAPTQMEGQPQGSATSPQAQSPDPGNPGIPREVAPNHSSVLPPAGPDYPMPFNYSEAYPNQDPAR